jgi:small subunit ribosomal protein S16
MLVIRLFRVGKKNQPSFKIVVTDKRRPPRAGRFVEEVGFWNPLTKEKVLKKERIKYWMSAGAKPSDTVHNLLISEEIIEGKKIDKHKKPKKKPSEASAKEGEKTIADQGEKPASEVKPEEKPAEKEKVKEATPEEKKSKAKEGKIKEEIKKETKKEKTKEEEKPAKKPKAGDSKAPEKVEASAEAPKVEAEDVPSKALAAEEKPKEVEAPKEPKKVESPEENPPAARETEAPKEKK